MADDLLMQAMKTLENFVLKLSKQAGMAEGYGENLWAKIEKSPGVLQELAYYHDYGKFLCKHVVEGYSLADILIWQVDHFKLYMDRHEEMNRYRQERLFLESLETLLQMEENPEPVIRKMQGETGTDQQNP